MPTSPLQEEQTSAPETRHDALLAELACATTSSRSGLSLQMDGKGAGATTITTTTAAAAIRGGERSASLQPLDPHLLDMTAAVEAAAALAESVAAQSQLPFRRPSFVRSRSSEETPPRPLRVGGDGRGEQPRTGTGTTTQSKENKAGKRLKSPPAMCVPLRRHLDDNHTTGGGGGGGGGGGSGSGPLPLMVESSADPASELSNLSVLTAVVTKDVGGEAMQTMQTMHHVLTIPSPPFTSFPSKPKDEALPVDTKNVILQNPSRQRAHSSTAADTGTNTTTTNGFDHEPCERPRRSSVLELDDDTGVFRRLDFDVENLPKPPLRHSPVAVGVWGAESMHGPVNKNEDEAASDETGATLNVKGLGGAAKANEPLVVNERKGGRARGEMTRADEVVVMRRPSTGKSGRHKKEKSSKKSSVVMPASPQLATTKMTEESYRYNNKEQSRAQEKVHLDVYKEVSEHGCSRSVAVDSFVSKTSRTSTETSDSGYFSDPPVVPPPADFSGGAALGESGENYWAKPATSSTPPNVSACISSATTFSSSSSFITSPSPGPLPCRDLPPAPFGGAHVEPIDALEVTTLVSRGQRSYSSSSTKSTKSALHSTGAAATIAASVSAPAAPAWSRASSLVSPKKWFSLGRKGGRKKRAAAAKNVVRLARQNYIMHQELELLRAACATSSSDSGEEDGWEERGGVKDDEKGEVCEARAGGRSMSMLDKLHGRKATLTAELRSLRQQLEALEESTQDDGTTGELRSNVTMRLTDDGTTMRPVSIFRTNPMADTGV